MKQFSLEEAKAGKPVCTRDGRDARIICFDLLSTHKTLIALVRTKVRDIINQERWIEEIYTFHNNGLSQDGIINDDALFMKSTTEKRWAIMAFTVMNLTDPPKINTFHGCIEDYRLFLSRTDAENHVNNLYQKNNIQIIEFEIEV